jgi:hypothetical protein
VETQSVLLVFFTSFVTIAPLQEKPSALKREHPVLKSMKILDFFVFLCVIFALLDPVPDLQFECGSGSGSSNSN